MIPFIDFKKTMFSSEILTILKDHDSDFLNICRENFFFNRV